MKKIFFFTILFSLSAFVMRAQSSDEATVTELVSKLNKAIIDVDTVTLRKMTDKDLSFGHSSGKVESQQEFITNVDKGPIHFQSIDVSNLKVTVAGKEAIVRHDFFGKMTKD